MIDTSWFAYNDAISSAVMLWQGGMEGGLVAADILTGEANPSGKLDKPAKELCGFEKTKELAEDVITEQSEQQLSLALIHARRRNSRRD